MEQAEDRGAHMSPAQAKPVAKQRNLRDATEIAFAYLLILAVVWAPRPWQRFLWLLAFAGIAIIVWRSFDGWRAMGFTMTNFGRSLWIAAAALLIAGATVAVAARLH